MTIVEALKKKIEEGGGSTSGIADIKDAVKALGNVGGGSSSANSVATIETFDLIDTVIDENTIVIDVVEPDDQLPDPESPGGIA